MVLSSYSTDEMINLCFSSKEELLKEIDKLKIKIADCFINESLSNYKKDKEYKHQIEIIQKIISKK